jgi:SHS2 domain-containing protein
VSLCLGGESPAVIPYRRLEHTSDVKVEIYGADLAGLFTNAATCLFDLILDLKKVREADSVSVSLESADLPELFLDWLRELLFFFSTRSLAIRRVEIGSVGPTRVVATAFGEEFDQERHGLKVEVKTPTYHQYRIDKTDEGYTATVVFDV